MVLAQTKALRPDLAPVIDSALEQARLATGTTAAPGLIGGALRNVASFFLPVDDTVGALDRVQSSYDLNPWRPQGLEERMYHMLLGPTRAQEHLGLSPKDPSLPTLRTQGGPLSNVDLSAFR